MAKATIRVRGLRETMRAFNKLERTVAAEVRSELKKAAEPVAELARRKLARFPGASLSTIGPRARGGSVFVTQRARKVTGRRGDFGALQMRRGLIPALDERQDAVVGELEQALDRLTRSEGF